MPESKLLSNFIADLKFIMVQTVQLEDQGPSVRGQQVNIGRPLVLLSGKLAEGSEVVNVFPNESIVADTLLEIMRKASQADSAWMCAPIYRDALVFLNEQNEVVNVLNICFSCRHLLDGFGNSLSCDEASFEMLGELLKSYGHIVDRKA